MIRPIVNKRRQAALRRFASLLETRRKRKKGRRGSLVESPSGVPSTAGNKLQELSQDGLRGQMMNNGGEKSLPPMMGNSWSPTKGQGMDNLNNTIRRNRPEYY